MASELVYLLELIAEAVVFVLKRTIDLVCALLYVVSILPPWRAIEELFNPRRFDEGYDDYWGYCARSFFLTLFDVIALPMGLISVPNPLRWSSLAIIFRRYFNSTNSDYMWELRGSLFFSGLICLLDMLCFPFGVAAMLMGVRSFVVVRESALHLPQIMRPVGDSLDSIKELELDINWVFFTQFWMSLLDVLVFSVSLPFVACSLHLWKSWSDGIPRLRSKYLTRFEEEYFNSRMNSYGDFYGDLRLFFFNKIVQVLLDIAALPFACFALLSPIRNSVFRNSCSKNGLNWCVCAKPPDVVEIQQQDIVEEDSTSYKPSPEQVLFYDTVHLEFNYNIQIRLDAFYYGLLSFSDVLLLPFLVPLCVTWYRFRPVQTQLVSAESWGCKQISTVSFQTMLLMFDLLILPCNAVIFLTRFRWNPVRLKYEEDDLCSMKSFATYGAIIRSFLLLCLDVIVCPFTFFVLITHYRSSSPWLILKTQSVYNGPMNRALIFHCSVLIQFFIVVHDIFLMFPAFLFSSLFFYRSIHMVRLPKTALVEPAAIDAVAEDTLSELCILNRLADMTTDGLEWRCYMWVEIFSIPLDVLTILLPSIIVVGTLWRAPALIYSIVAIDKSYKKKLGDISGAVVTPVERMCRFELYWIIRRCALKQVCLLMLDILCLVPFCIIIGSLYRLPGVILQLFAKFHETKHLSLRLHNAVVSDPDSATVEPLLKCSSVRMEFPERGGPRVIVRATRNTAAPSDTIETADSPTIAPICFAAPAVAKMHVLGKLFWRIVEQVFGSTASSVGKSMLPLILRDGAGISLEAISTQLNIGVEEAIGEIEFWVQFDAGNTKRSTIVKNIQKMYNGAVPIVLQFEVDINRGVKTERAILFTIAPTFSELLDAAERGDSYLPRAALDLTRDRHLLDASRDVSSEDEFAVDSFIPVVLMAFIQLCLDILYFMMFLFVALLPWRLYKLVATLLHSEDTRLLDIAEHVLDLKREADRNLNEYRMALLPILNEMAKRSDNDWNGYYWLHSPLLNRIEKFGLLRYSEMYTRLLNVLKKNEGKGGGIGLDALAISIPRLKALQHQRLLAWGLKTALHLHLSGGTFDEVIHGSAVEVVRIKDKSYRKQQQLLESQIQADYDGMKTRVAGANGRAKFKYLLKRSVDETRKIIKDAFKDALKDIAVLFLLFFLVVTLSELPAFLADLIRNRSSNAHSLRETIVVHVKKSADKKKRLLIFCGYSLAVFALVVGIPAYIEKLPRCTSLDEATELAKKTVKKSMWYFCEILSLFAVFRTYRLAVVALIYALFVPAACITEALPFGGSSQSARKPKFFLSIIIWFFVLAITIAAIVVSESSDEIQEIRTIVVVAVGIAVGITMCASYGVHVKEVAGEAVSSQVKAVSIFKPFAPTWSNILALLAAPLETIQLSAVVLFYFWVSPAEYEVTNSTVHYYASRILLWGGSSGNASHALKISVILAVCLILFWLVLSSLPLAYGGSQLEKRLKILKMQTSASFNFISVFLSQLVFVWLVSTLLRPSSCIETLNGPIVSTALGAVVPCGDGSDASWAFRLSLPLLVYFCFTCTMLHSTSDIKDTVDALEEADERRYNSFTRDEFGSEKKDGAVQLVWYDQIYSHFLHTFQIIVCLTCSVGLASASKAVPLIIIALSCFIMALGPALFFRFSCSLGSVIGLRAVGSLLVCWTAIVCIFKTSPDSYEWANSRALFIGWICISAVGLFVVCLVERVRHENWIATLNEAHLPETINSLLSIADNLTIDDALSDSQSSNSPKKSIITSIQSAKSFSVVCNLMVSLERRILAERLTADFLSRRQVWCEEVIYWRFTGESSILKLQSLLAVLKGGIRSTNPLTLVSRNILSITFKRKCPEEIAWEIFGYLFDSTNLRKVLDKILKEVDSDLKYRPEFTAENMVWKQFALIRQRRSELLKLVVHDNSMYGKSPAPAVLSNIAERSNTRPANSEYSSFMVHDIETPLEERDSFEGALRNSEEIQISMDRQLAEQLAYEN